MSRQLQTCTAPRHDPTPSCYTWWGCRCPATRAAVANYRRAQRNGTHISPFVTARPTVERIHILAGLGHGWASIAPHIGQDTPRTFRLSRLKHDAKIRPTTAQRVETGFAHLTTQPPPCGYAAAKALNTAMRAGWGVVDRVAVDMALAGCDIHLSPLERLAALYIGHARGLPPAQFAAAAHMSHTTAAKRLGPADPTIKRGAA